ncbi:MAG: L,D-transpeptidase [Pseudomonadota bacterium]
MRLRLVVAAVMLLGMLGAGDAFAAQVLISINKSNQKMTVSIDGEKTYVWPVSTGAPGYSTPSGDFRPFRMERDHFSKEWDDAPMPHSIFFTMQGHAIHGSPHTKRLGTRASHGCVRLAPPNAAKLFALVQKNGMKNTRVVVKGGFGFDFDLFSSRSSRSSRSSGISDYDYNEYAPRKNKKKRNPLAGLGDIFD